MNTLTNVPTTTFTELSNKLEETKHKTRRRRAVYEELRDINTLLADLRTRNITFTEAQDRFEEIRHKAEE